MLEFVCGIQNKQQLEFCEQFKIFPPKPKKRKIRENSECCLRQIYQFRTLDSENIQFVDGLQVLQY